MNKFLSKKTVLILLCAVLVLAAYLIYPLVDFYIIHPERVEELRQRDLLRQEIAAGNKDKIEFHKLNEEIVIDKSGEKLYSLKVTAAKLYNSFAETGIPFDEIESDSLIFQNTFTNEELASVEKKKATVDNLRFVTCTLEFTGIKDIGKKDADYDSFSLYGLSIYDKVKQKIIWTNSFPHIDKPMTAGETALYHIRVSKGETKQITLGYFVLPTYQDKEFYLTYNYGDRKPLYIDLNLNT